MDQRIAAIEALLRPIAKYKLRSHETSQLSHIPLLTQSSHSDNSQQTQRGPSVILFGDSMIERMTTTGVETPTSLVGPWPPEAMVDDETTWRQEGVLNAGVGGDRIQNMAYRLVGDPATSLPGLAATLLATAQTDIKLWVVQAGTNNLTPKKGLTEKDRDALELLLQSLLIISGPESKILLTGLFPRKDIPVELIGQANDKLVGITREMNDGLGKEGVVFLPATGAVKTEDHLVDHVHLNLEGYRLWMRELLPAVSRVLRSST
ncbi:SGNH hydrolase-type esterase domain-containing protein [Apodospora peruviana]|uniref:SGNH hydrolase-type esterase domain-containing protein n=1 Tax=Apodospora peruviana TaxID=516989 RepID=A0AAE0I285_9PEZI|nr:SGNH hydrolase-type esterase domain-containing protein [Apodospora peruviana]